MGIKMNKDAKYWYNMAKTFMQNQPDKALQYCDVASRWSRTDAERKEIAALKNKIKEMK